MDYGISHFQSQEAVDQLVRSFRRRIQPVVTRSVPRDRRSPRKGSIRPDRSRFLTPFFVFGTNAISAYVFSELLQSLFGAIHPRSMLNLQQVLYQSIQHIVSNQALASLLYSLGFVAVCWLFVSVLYRRKIFIRV